jgi:hypothetical protein
MLGAGVVAITFGCSQAPEITIRPELARGLRRIAVLDLVDAPGADAGHSGRVVAGVLSSTALNVNGWSVVERQQLSRIIEEQDLQKTDLVDPTTAVRVGRIAGADGVIIGEVAQYRIGSIPFLFFFTWDQDTYKVDFAFRLISVSTGEVCVSARVSRTSLESFERAISDGAIPIFERIDSCLAIREPAGTE